MSEFKTWLDSQPLPPWMDKGEPLKLFTAVKQFWLKTYGWMQFPLQQFDAETCDVALLDAMAYQRDIQRFNGEPLALYRLRVKFAFINAVDAGSVAGFINIFKRLDVGDVTLAERQPAHDWDVVLVQLNDEQLGTYNTLMMDLIRQYGRTCRRYYFDVQNMDTSRIRAAEFSHDTAYYAADVDIVHGLVEGRIPANAPAFTSSTEYYTASQ
ncbi:hypothetical protein SOASR015_06600 [Pectobacterium carotovorum subsp. carotovorum]|nr:hypothetical protein SOASR015_06600 [Pectobacterium carotovorum subsp. carotovorum]GLX54985.1 hypothetical protein Pcaca02_02940 [Pectobacterium carotovorum subsp. carotovorum]